MYLQAFQPNSQQYPDIPIETILNNFVDWHPLIIELNFLYIIESFYISLMTKPTSPRYPWKRFENISTIEFKDSSTLRGFPLTRSEIMYKKSSTFNRIAEKLYDPRPYRFLKEKKNNNYLRFDQNKNEYQESFGRSMKNLSRVLEFYQENLRSYKNERDK